MGSPENELLEQTFPNLSPTGYRVTSPRTRDYNCVAWAAGRNTENWDHSQTTFAYWPRRVSRDGSVESLVAVFRTLGFSVCEGGDFEPLIEKIAIYSEDGRRWTHVARQLANGNWSSKLGGLEDIEHESLVALAGSDYGSPVRFLGRKRAAG